MGDTAYGRCGSQDAGASVKNFSNSSGKVRPLTAEEIALGESYAWTAA
jgi:hypothetical protein